MRKIFRYFRKSRFSYKPLVEITISKERLLHNLNAFKKIFKKGRVAPVLKSNAYGHGLIQIATILDREDIPFLIVDSYYEALVLRNEGIRSEILILGYTLPENIFLSNLRSVAFTITDLAQLKILSEKLSAPRTFHLKIDTGMHRQGVPLNELVEAYRLINANPNIILEGICSHLANADADVSDQFNTMQIEQWNAEVKIAREKVSGIKYFHLSATAGSFYAEGIDANVMRLGLGLYGISANENLKLDLRPVLTMKSMVSGIKEIKKGDKVGYNITFEAQQDMKIATIPVGYYEGVDRRLSNIGFFKVNDLYAPIVGRVSMNISLIDISSIEGAKIEDEVTVISTGTDDKNSIRNIAIGCKTIPYEILIHLPQHIRRTVI